MDDTAAGRAAAGQILDLGFLNFATVGYARWFYHEVGVAGALRRSGFFAEILPFVDGPRDALGRDLMPRACRHVHGRAAVFAFRRLRLLAPGRAAAAGRRIQAV